MFAADYREIARKALKGKWKRVTAILLLAGLLYGGVELVRISVEIRGIGEGTVDGQIVGGGTAALTVLLGLLALSLGAWVRVGSFNMGNRLMDGEAPRAGMLFPPDIFWKCVAMNLLRTLYVFLWSLLLIIPGIMASYSYSMADYLLSRHPEMSASEALRESKRMMMGRRGNLFCLEMSFIGWVLLCQVPVHVIGYLAVGLRASGALAVSLVLLGVLFYWIASCFLDSYIHMAEVAFFRDAEAPELDPQEAAGFSWGDAEDGQAASEEPADDGAPGEDAGRRVTALTADETVARDVFVRHGCSRNRLRAEGLMEEYEKLNVDSSFELRWLREYANGLMLRFDRDPAALDEILELSAEYAMDDLITRALERIERHIRQETLPGEEILNMAGRVLALVVSGTFEDRPDFVRRRKAQVADIADRMEHRLSEEQGDGSWRRALELIRQMCQ